MNAEIFETFDVQLPDQAYSIVMGANLLSEASLFEALKPVNQALIVTNETIAPLYLNQLKRIIPANQIDSVILPDGEQYKNQTSLEKIYHALLSHFHHRQTVLFALGGGVVGDITGFAAATYQRGVRFVQCPTTLLAQVDASIGGKTAINHPLGKNMIGSFYQPQGVFIDLNTLHTLPEREFRAGLGEVIKYGLIAGGATYEEMIDWLPTNLDKLEQASLAKIILSCCKIKAEIVAQDEKEQGRRAILNLGHTFAHALEACSHYKRWHHGEAVAIGLYCAALLSHRLGKLDDCEVQRLDECLANCGLPRRIPDDIAIESLLTSMRQDKKNKDQKIRFILFSQPGRCYIEDEVTETQIVQVLQAAIGKG